MVLFVNGCVRENSRTKELADVVLKNVAEDVEEIRLYPDGPEGLDNAKLCLRNELLEKKQYDLRCFALPVSLLRRIRL